MKAIIQLSENELHLIKNALDIYCRMGLGQFWYLTDVHTVRENVWAMTDDKREEFEFIAKKLSNIYTGHSGNVSYGITSQKVGADCKVACHINHAIRHELYKHRGDKNKSTVDAYPSDIPSICGIDLPDFYIEIKSK